jgi:peroxiredoxin
MAIQAGDKIPNATLKKMGAEGMTDVTTDQLFSGKRVVLFAVPGAFTPTCSAQHLPGFVAKAAEIKAKGIDTIACVSVNDAFVMDAWGKSGNVGDSIEMLADGNGDFAKALGLDFDGSAIGFGIRAQRFAAIVDDGVVKHLAVEKPMKFEVSSAEAILEAL